MFFEEEYINNLLKCDKCIQNFSKYDQPKSLPCGKIICDKCETLIYKESNKERKFKCTLCSNEHSIPDEGFNLNDLAYSLITAKPKEIWRGKKYEQLKINLNKIEQLVQELKLNYENGADKIKEHCIEQRRLVQLSTEKKIEKINKINEELINQINDFESQCIISFSKKENSIKIKLNLLVDEADKFLKEKQDYLKQLKIDKEEIKKFNEISEDLQTKLKNELNIKNNTIFGDNLIKFNSNICNVEQDIIGNIDYDFLYHLEILSGSDDETIKFWDLESKESTKKFVGHSESVVCVKKLSNDKLISASLDGTIKIWDFNTTKCIKTIKDHSGIVNKIELISDDKFASCSSDKTIKLFDLNTFKCIRTFIGHKDNVWDIEKFTSNKKIISCSSDASIRVWELESGKCLKGFRDSSNFIICVRLFQDEKIIFGSGNLIKILDIHSGFCFLLEGHSDLISRIIRISNEKIASCSFDKTIKIWNMITGECLRTIEAHSNFVRFMIELPNNKIISCSDDKKIKVWDTDTGYCLKTLKGHDRTVRFIEILQ